MTRKSPEHPPEVKQALNQERLDRLVTSRVAENVGYLLQQGGSLQMTAESNLGNGHLPVVNSALEFYKAMVVQRSVSVHGPQENLEDIGLGISLHMTIPCATSEQSAVSFVLDFGRGQIELPYDGTVIDEDLIASLIPETEREYMKPALSRLTSMAHKIGIKPNNIFDASDNFLRSATLPSTNNN